MYLKFFKQKSCSVFYVKATWFSMRNLDGSTTCFYILSLVHEKSIFSLQLFLIRTCEVKQDSYALTLYTVFPRNWICKMWKFSNSSCEKFALITLCWEIQQQSLKVCTNFKFAELQKNNKAHGASIKGHPKNVHNNSIVNWCVWQGYHKGRLQSVKL